ncbi:MAG: GNAT family N-acetyltransferase [Anaerolineae bacterium]|nr:GNAT family N-acetyltransferase [Anaerolineae bacterium]
MSGQIETLYRLQKKDILKATAVAAAAFQSEPFWNAIVGDKTEQLAGAYEAPLRYCFTYGDVYAPSEAVEGIAAWVSSDFADMTPWRLLRSGSLVAGFKVGMGNMLRMLPVFGAMDADRIKNMKGKSYFHFQIFCVAPELQGRGLGGKMLRALIEKSEQAGVYIYLETQTEENVRMYEKFGFEVVLKHVMPKVNLPVWDMVRKPA